MGLFDLFKETDINRGVQEARESTEILLLDVRGTEEFRQGHIPGALNIPLGRISDIRRIIKNKDTHIYVYCLRGTRSKRAVAALKKAGYTNARSIGGINRYKGRLEKGSRDSVSIDEMIIMDILD